MGVTPPQVKMALHISWEIKIYPNHVSHNFLLKCSLNTGWSPWRPKGGGILVHLVTTLCPGSGWVFQHFLRPSLVPFCSGNHPPSPRNHWYGTLDVPCQKKMAERLQVKVFCHIIYKHAQTVSQNPVYFVDIVFVHHLTLIKFQF